VTQKARPATGEQLVTLTDDDIRSERSVSRRSLLGAFGTGAAIAASAALGRPDDAMAADSSTKKGKKDKKAPKNPPPKEESDSD
jgi:hypothetical protein